LHVTFGLAVQKLWDFEDFSPSLGMQQNLPKTAQNCPNLPKSAQKQNFEIPPKIKILVFFKNKNLYM
jgi:hypothetical protein